MWVDDPDFDINRHVRHVALPAPGRIEQLEELAMLVVADPFDRNRPLWEFVVVDGLAGGQGAIIQKIHHVLTDGEGGIRLSMQFLDLTADAPEPPATSLSHDLHAPEPPPSTHEVMNALVQGAFRGPLSAVRQIRDLLAEPHRIPSAGQATVATARAVVAQLRDTDKARSPLWTTRSLGRAFTMTSVPLDPVKDVAKKLGGTLNTAFVTAAAHAAGSYHRDLGAPVDALRTSMAISTRTAETGEAGNAFSLVRLLVPTSDMSIVDRFHAVHELTASAKSSSASSSLDQLAAVTSALPTSLVTRVARQQAETVDFATSNVRAAPFTVYIAGAKVLRSHPVGPVGGVAFNLTLMSYNGSLDMGLTTDTASVTDTPLLAGLLSSAFDQLVTPPKKSRKRRPTTS
jgi:diacylglycerol O-acyltransferase / wax synthase